LRPQRHRQKNRNVKQLSRLRMMRAHLLLA